MSVSLINRIKYSKLLYKIYYHCGNFAIACLKLFIKPQNDLIVFVSFGGRKYDDSPRCIYEQMIDDHRFDQYKFVWAFIDPARHVIARGEKIKIDTFKYYKTILAARCWITNSSVERGLSFKGKNVFYFNTWHGTPIKKMGSDIDANSQAFSSKGKDTVTDIMLAQGQYEADIFSRVFNIDIDRFRIIGLPRNDELVPNNDVHKDIREKIFKTLHIPTDKKIILYAPTFREYLKEDNNCIIAPPIDLNKWKARLSDEYVVLFRAHYEITKALNIVEDSFTYNVSDYGNLNELMIASDVLISDYSSIFFDYSILNKPMFCFAYDYEEYSTKRGLYFDMRPELGSQHIATEDDLLDAITTMDEEVAKGYCQEFRDKYITAYGKASKLSADIIYNAIK